MKTMTLNLSEREMEALEKLAKEKGMSKTALVRLAFRMYQSIDLRLSKGGRFFFEGDDNKKAEVILL